jgi:carboxyl-terminal processing protease
LRGIVLDLRGDSGGLLQQSIKVADLFLADGQILSTRGRHPDSNRDYVADGEDIAADLPLVIVIDGILASAAEIVVAVLQDRQRAVVIGSSSYGKGTIQTVVPLPNGGELSITWSQAVPPGGGVLTGTGVTPAVCTSGLYVADPDVIDRVLRRAVGPDEQETDTGCRPRSGGTAPSIWKSTAA